MLTKLGLNMDGKWKGDICLRLIAGETATGLTACNHFMSTPTDFEIEIRFHSL
jgi:hypothetical protein